MNSGVHQMWRLKMEDLNPIRFRKSDSSPRFLGQENILFETLDLGPLPVANWKLEFQGVWGEGFLCSLVSWPSRVLVLEL